MSLDLTLRYDQPETEYQKAIKLLQEAGLNKAANCLEWETDPERADDAFSINITHNLNSMAEAAGIYQHLWRPEEIGVVHAKEMIQPLKDGLEKLEADPDKYRAFNAENGWGVYENFVPFVRAVLDACQQHPDAKVYVSR